MASSLPPQVWANASLAVIPPVFEADFTGSSADPITIDRTQPSESKGGVTVEVFDGSVTLDNASIDPTQTVDSEVFVPEKAFDESETLEYGPTDPARCLDFEDGVDF